MVNLVNGSYELGSYELGSYGVKELWSYGVKELSQMFRWR